MGLGEKWREAIEELAGEDNSNPEPKGSYRYSESSDRRGFSGWGEDSSSDAFDVYDPPKDDMQEYWRAFETTPFVRQSVTSYAREVVEPGWWVEADSDETAKELAKWLRQAAIVEGEKNRDLALLLRKIVVQLTVRGTVLIEHVPDADSDDSIAALKLLNPETVSTFTKEGSSLLLDPDDDVPSGDIPKTESGETPAYVQFYEDRFSERDPIPFTREEMTKIVRDADVGEQYGTSVLESVLPRIEALQEKLADKDQAIKQKAWPTWIFQFGAEDDPWHPDDIDSFMEQESGDNFGPGTKHGVQGDVQLQTIGGDVPELKESISYDINHIISALPMPKFATGFAEDINQFVSQQQENRIRRQVRETRRELEYALQEVLEMKAEQMGLNVDGLNLRIAPPEGKDPMSIYEDRGTTIRYIGKDQGFTSGSTDGTVTNQFDPDYKKQQQQKQQQNATSDGGSSGSSEQSETDTDAVAELAFPEEGDIVKTEDGKGVVVSEMREPFKWPPTNEQIQASKTNEAYVVAHVDKGSAVYRADELEETNFRGGNPRTNRVQEAEMGDAYGQMDTPTSIAYSMIEPEAPEAEELALTDVADRSDEVGLSEFPDGWTRKSLLKWWASIGGTWRECHRELKFDMGSKQAREHCAAVKDEVIGFSEWRNTF